MKKSLLFAGIIVILVVAGVGTYWYRSEAQYKEMLSQSVSDESEPVSFVIKKGESAKQIAERLVTNRVVVADWVFLRYIKEKNADQALKSGSFVLNRNDTIPALVDVLTGKTVRQVSVRIPEGYTVKKIDALLKELELVEGNEFLDCLKNCPFDYDFLPQGEDRNLEGYLFPSTYFVDPVTFTPQSFIDRLLSTFQQRFSPMKADIKNRSVADIVNMASLIERETVSAEERSIVSGILWKRLDNRWYLGVDATLHYYKDDWYNPLTYQDLKDQNNPYNTRLKHGLPPTPIANPGLESLKASVYPEESPYWYYLHDAERQIHYAKDLQEHERNKVKYLQ